MSNWHPGAESEIESFLMLTTSGARLSRGSGPVPSFVPLSWDLIVLLSPLPLDDELGPGFVPGSAQYPMGNVNTYWHITFIFFRFQRVPHHDIGRAVAAAKTHEPWHCAGGFLRLNPVSHPGPGQLNCPQFCATLRPKSG